MTSLTFEHFRIGHSGKVSMLLLSRISIVFLICFATTVSVSAQETDTDDSATEAVEKDANANEEPPVAPKTVSVDEVVEDYQIDRRLREILTSTEWYESVSVKVENGVVFLTGVTADEKYRTWAGELASKTEDVVAVVNRIKVTEPPLLDLDPAWAAARDMLRSAVRALPMTVLSIGLLVLTWFIGSAVQKIADWTFLKRIQTNLLREVCRKAVLIPVFIIGAFLVLRITGLSQLAMTVLGGTGLFGLVIGIAFRDIAENFLSSILLSVQNPFRYGDLIEVDEHIGFVQRVNTRGTLLMTFEGNHIQIPNAQVYKGTIINYTSNPNRRFTFTIGIGYDTSATEAQDSAMRVLADHPAILKDPEPQILVEELASSTINLTVYAWVNAEKHSWPKVKSSVMRLTLKAFEGAGFSMPDDQREIVFPSGVPVEMLEQQSQRVQTEQVQPKEKQSAKEDLSNSAEGDFRSEADEINRQAQESRDPEDDDVDLLQSGDKKTDANAEKRDLAAV